jgi:hypothetical protein
MSIYRSHQGQLHRAGRLATYRPVINKKRKAYSAPADSEASEACQIVGIVNILLKYLNSAVNYLDEPLPTEAVHNRSISSLDIEWSSLWLWFGIGFKASPPFSPPSSSILASSSRPHSSLPRNNHHTRALPRIHHFPSPPYLLPIIVSSSL